MKKHSYCRILFHLKNSPNSIRITIGKNDSNKMLPRMRSFGFETLINAVNNLLSNNRQMTLFNYFH